MKGESKSSRLGGRENQKSQGRRGKDGGLQETLRYLGCSSAILLQKLKLKQYFSAILL